MLFDQIAKEILDLETGQIPFQKTSRPHLYAQIAVLISLNVQFVPSCLFQLIFILDLCTKHFIVLFNRVVFISKYQMFVLLIYRNRCLLQLNYLIGMLASIFCFYIRNVLDRVFEFLLQCVFRDRVEIECRHRTQLFITKLLQLLDFLVIQDIEYLGFVTIIQIE